jgi:hypothetical protein
MNTQDIGARWKRPITVYAIVPARRGVAETFGADSAAGRLVTIATGAFAAVVGDGPPAGSLGRRREELAPQLLAHQRTLEQIMQATPLLPVRFGTSVPDETSVRAVLERGEPAFAAAFSRMEGCVELEVLIKWDIAAIFAEIANEEAVAGLKQKLELNVGAPEEASRAALGRLVKDALERRRAALAATLFATLQAVAVDAIAYPATADQVVLHLVLLIKSGERTAFDRCLEALDIAHDGRLTFRCVGPLAPYSFATVEIEILDATALAQAGRLLEVGPGASAAQVRAAYRRLARTIHPDIAGPGVGNSASMVALSEACRILSLNAQADGSQRGTEEGLSTGDPHFAGRSVLVSVRRQERAFDAAA